MTVYRLDSTTWGVGGVSAQLLLGGNKDQLIWRMRARLGPITTTA